MPIPASSERGSNEASIELDEVEDLVIESPVSIIPDYSVWVGREIVVPMTNQNLVCTHKLQVAVRHVTALVRSDDPLC